MNTYVCISLEHEAQCIHADNHLLYTTHLVAAAACLQEAPPDEKLEFFNSDRGCTFTAAKGEPGTHISLSEGFTKPQRSAVSFEA